jgi:hypothetical protein
LLSRFCDHIISRQRLHSTLWYIEENHDSSPVTK